MANGAEVLRETKVQFLDQATYFLYIYWNIRTWPVLFCRVKLVAFNRGAQQTDQTVCGTSPLYQHTCAANHDNCH